MSGIYVIIHNHFEFYQTQYIGEVHAVINAVLFILFHFIKPARLLSRMAIVHFDRKNNGLTLSLVYR